MNFNETAYYWAQQVPHGRVTTYGAIARLCGNPRASRAVGWAMGQNHSPDVPCHRVVNRSGTLAPSHVFGGMQRAMLEAEGVPFLADGRVDLAKCLWLGPEA